MPCRYRSGSDDASRSAASAHFTSTPGAIASWTVPSSLRAVTVPYRPEVVITSVPKPIWLARTISWAAIRRRLRMLIASRPNSSRSTIRYGQACFTASTLRVEQGGPGRRRRAEAQMGPGRRGGDTAAGRACEQAGPDEERLGHLLDGRDLLAHSNRDRADAHRPAPEPAHQGVQDG